MPILSQTHCLYLRRLCVRARTHARTHIHTQSINQSINQTGKHLCVCTRSSIFPSLTLSLSLSACLPVCLSLPPSLPPSLSLSIPPSSLPLSLLSLSLLLLTHSLARAPSRYLGRRGAHTACQTQHCLAHPRCLRLPPTPCNISTHHRPPCPPLSSYPPISRPGTHHAHSRTYTQRHMMYALFHPLRTYTHTQIEYQQAFAGGRGVRTLACVTQHPCALGILVLLRRRRRPYTAR